MIKKLIFTIILLLPSLLFAQVNKNDYKSVGISHTTSKPNWTPTPRKFAEIARDSSSGLWWIWSSGAQDWYATNQIEISSAIIAPNYTPAKGRPRFVINAVDSLYHWNGSSWKHLNLFVGADGWGADVVNHDATLSGNGTVGTPLKVDTSVMATLFDVAVVQADINAHEAADGDLSAINEIQRLDTFEIVSNILRASLLNDGVPFSSVDLSSYAGGGGGGIYDPGSGTTGEKVTTATVDSILVFTANNDVGQFDVNMISTLGLFGSRTLIRPDSARISYTDLVGTNYLSVGPDGVRVNTLPTDRLLINGNDARYVSDVSLTFSNLSLINKAWADSTYIGTFNSYGGSVGDVLKWNGLRWAPADDLTGGLLGTNAKEDGATIVVSATAFDFKSGFDVSADLTEADITMDLSEVTEQVQDEAWDVLTGTQTGITVTYDDTNNEVDFVVTDASATNEIQRLDTFAIVSNVLRASLLNDGVPFSSVDLSLYLDNKDEQNLTIEGASAPFTIAISGGSDVNIDAGTGISLAESPANTLVITNSAPDQTVVLNEGAGIDIAGTYPSFTITNTVIDHGALTGLSDDDHSQYLLLAGRSGGQVATGGTGVGDDLTLRSTSNATKGEVIIADQGGNIILGGGATASEVRIMEASGSGTNYTGFLAQPMSANLVNTLPAAFPVANNYALVSTTAGVWSYDDFVSTTANNDIIFSTDGLFLDVSATLGTIYYQTLLDENVAITQQIAANFLQTATINPTLTNDGAGSETEITLDVRAESIQSSHILDGTIANGDLNTGVGGIYKGNGTIAPAAVSTLTSASSWTVDFSDGSDALAIIDASGVDIWSKIQESHIELTGNIGRWTFDSGFFGDFNNNYLGIGIDINDNNADQVILGDIFAATPSYFIKVDVTDEILINANGSSILMDAVSAIYESGVHNFYGTLAGGGAATLRLFEESAEGTEFFGLSVQPMAASTSYLLPNAYPVGNANVLISSGAGTMSWDTRIDGTGVVNQVAYFTDTEEIGSDADFTFNGTNAAIGGVIGSYRLSIYQAGTDDGIRILDNSGTQNFLLYQTGTTSTWKATGNTDIQTASGTILLRPPGGSGFINGVEVVPLAAKTDTFQGSTFLHIAGTFAPTIANVNSAQPSSMRISTTVNQTGGANQPYSLIDLDPAITAAPNGLYGIFYEASTHRFLWQPEGDTVKSYLRGRLGIGENAFASTLRLYVGGTDAIKIPYGSNAQRPTGPAGMLRVNSDTDVLEFYDGTDWQSSGGTGDNWGTQVVEHGSTLTGDGTSGSPLDVATDGITATHIAAGAVGNSELASGAVTDAKVTDVGIAKITSGNLVSGFAATIPATTSSARINYNNSNPGLLVDDQNSGTSIYSEDGVNYVLVDNTSIQIGTENVVIGGGTAAAELRLLEPSGSGTNYSAFKAQAQTGNVTYTLPAADGSNGQVLSTNGTGTLSWATSSGGSTDLAFSGTSTPVTLTSSTGTDVMFLAGVGVTLSADADELTINTTAPQPASTETIENANFTATIRRVNNVDCSGGAITVTPPSSPAINDRFSITDSKASSGTNNITINFSGSSQKLYGTVQNYVLNFNGGYVEFIYMGSTTGWVATK